MASCRNLQDSSMTVDGYIESRRFGNVPDIVFDLPLNQIPIKGIVGLYEEVEMQIGSKVFTMLPDDYGGSSLNSEERRQLSELFLRFREK